MTSRASYPWVVLGLCALPWLAVILWGARGHRSADRATARADSLATEIVLERARADGWEVAVADTAAQLLQHLAALDSQGAQLSRELEAARARLIAYTSVVVSASGEVEAPRDPEVSTADSTIYLVEDGPLSGVITVWADSAAARLDWSVEISSELVHAEGADRRGLAFGRSPDPRVQVSIPTLEYQLPTIERPGFPWRWVGAALAGGYLLGRVL